MGEKFVKRQHYVPCAYLARFSREPDIKPRRSRIFRTDNNVINLPVTCETQCYIDFYYSSTDTVQKELDLKEIEDELQRITNIAQSGSPTKRDLRLLILHHAAMFSRGMAVENTTERTRFDVYNDASNFLLKHYFYHKEIDDLMDKEFAKYLFDNYVSIMLTTKEESLITSDNPVILFASNDNSEAVLSFLPLTSHMISVIYKRNSLKIKQKSLTIEDVGFLNAMQAHNSYHTIFSYDELEEKDIIAANKWFKKRRHPRLTVNKDHYNYDLPLVSTVKGRLSFVSSIT